MTNAMTPSRPCVTPVDHLFRDRRLLLWGIPATGVLVETLLDRGADGDVAEAEAAIKRLADAPADEGLAVREIWLLRLQALLARARGDEARLSRIPGSLPRHGEIAWLRRAYRVGRGDGRRPAVAQAESSASSLDESSAEGLSAADGEAAVAEAADPLRRCGRPCGRSVASSESRTTGRGVAGRSVGFICSEVEATVEAEGTLDWLYISDRGFRRTQPRGLGGRILRRHLWGDAGLNGLGGWRCTSDRRGPFQWRWRADEGRGVGDALADRVDQVGGHRRRIERRDQPCRGGFPRPDAAVIAQVHDHLEERLDHVDQLLGHPQGAQRTEQRQVRVIEEVVVGVAVGALVSRRRPSGSAGRLTSNGYMCT